MEFKLEQLMELKKYQELCNCLFDLAPNEEIKSNLEDILYRGKYGDLIFHSDICNKNNPIIEIKRRVSMADILIKNTSAMDILTKNQINIFHGTNANALPSILKYGLNSASESEKKGLLYLQVNSSPEDIKKGIL